MNEYVIFGLILGVVAAVAYNIGWVRGGLREQDRCFREFRKRILDGQYGIGPGRK